MSGVVDTDIHVSPINFFIHTLAKGAPLVQVIPFARDDERLQGVIRPSPSRRPRGGGVRLAWSREGAALSLNEAESSPLAAPQRAAPSRLAYAFPSALAHIRVSA